MKRCMALVMVAGMAGMAVAQDKAAGPTAEKVIITVTPSTTAPFAFPKYGIETIALVTDRGVMIPWRVTMPK